MSKLPRLQCPACDSFYLVYRKRAGVYWCRKCGCESQLTKRVDGYELKVVFSPFPERKADRKLFPFKPAAKKAVQKSTKGVK